VAWYSTLDRRYQRHFIALFNAARRLDPSARVTSTRRSTAEQTRLYRRWLAGQSRFPVARPGTSKHEKGLAVDLVARPEVLRRLGEAWERVGGRWGGRFNDEIHFEV